MYEILRLIRIRTIAFCSSDDVCHALSGHSADAGYQWIGFTNDRVGVFLLVVAVCCLISGAYVINDYFDTKSDRISGIKKGRCRKKH